LAGCFVLVLIFSAKPELERSAVRTDQAASLALFAAREASSPVNVEAVSAAAAGLVEVRKKQRSCALAALDGCLDALLAVRVAVVADAVQADELPHAAAGSAARCEGVCPEQRLAGTAAQAVGCRACAGRAVGVAGLPPRQTGLEEVVGWRDAAAGCSAHLVQVVAGRAGGAVVPDEAAGLAGGRAGPAERAVDELAGLVAAHALLVARVEEVARQTRVAEVRPLPRGAGRAALAARHARAHGGHRCVPVAALRAGAVAG